MRPIRSLLRGLDTLAALNASKGLTVSEAAARTGLPRTTAYRILETLRVGGFAVRDLADERYRPSDRVHDLADGADDERWVGESALPDMNELCKAVLWPVNLYIAYGNRLVLRAATDRRSPMALVRHSPGRELHMMNAPEGLAVLGDMPDDARAEALKGLVNGGLKSLLKGADDARAAGFVHRLNIQDGERALIVGLRAPNPAGGCVSGAVLVRYIASALSPERAETELLPPLRALTTKIETALYKASAQGPGATASAVKVDASPFE